MAYERLNLSNGITFNASHVKHLEDGIEAAMTAAESASGGSGPIGYVESLDESNLVNLRDLESGSYVLYGYFKPYAGAPNTLTIDTQLINVVRKSAGSQVLIFSTLNSVVNFLEILVDSTADTGFTYTRTDISMLDLHALIEKVGDLAGLSTTEKSSLVAAINEVAANAGSGGTVAASVEPAEDDIPKVFFVGEAPTTKAQDELPLTMEYRSKTATIKSYVTLKVQGDTSAGYAKKNFNLKMFSDEARSEKLKCTFRNWSKTHKYCLKANWIDHTHARNVVGGRLWAQVARSRADYDSYPTEYKESANCGAVNGFPVKVYLNGVYQGLYTWNIRKDSSMFNMDDSTGTHAALIADGLNDVTAWRATPQIDGSDWTDELNDTVPDAVKTAFQNVYDFVMNATDEEFMANVETHFYLSSLIDYFIYVYSILMIGGLAKSQTMFTYDAQKFLANIYDMDTTWALTWNGGGFYNVETACPDGYEGTSNLLYERLVALYPDRIKERYAELRTSVLSDANIINEFERFMDVIGNDLYAEDFASTTANGKFTAIPSADTNNLQKLREIIVKRMAYCDEQIPQIDKEEIPATGITLSASTLSFTEAEAQTLTATVEPSDTTDTVVWSSSNETVAKVSNGIVVPVASGSATITAMAGSVSATCEVTVDIEVVEEVALYPLVNGSNQTVTGVVTAEVTNGNHVKLVNTRDSTVSGGSYYNFTNVTSGTLGQAASITNQEKIFSLSEGDTVVYTISGDNVPSGSYGWRIANASTGISELVPIKNADGSYSIEATCSADYDVGSLFFSGAISANTTYEFDVSLTVNGEKYI